MIWSSNFESQGLTFLNWGNIVFFIFLSAFFTVIQFNIYYIATLNLVKIQEFMIWKILTQFYNIYICYVYIVVVLLGLCCNHFLLAFLMYFKVKNTNLLKSYLILPNQLVQHCSFISNNVQVICHLWGYNGVLFLFFLF